MQTVFTDKLCIECDACVDICPMDCITFTANGEEADLRARLQAPAVNLAQDLYVSGELKTGRIMAKDEDVCLHCGLCAERCPTGAWDMQKFLLDTRAGGRSVSCRSTRKPAVPTDRSRGGLNMRTDLDPAIRTNDFVVKFANVNGSGSASANGLFARAILRMGVPVAARNIFPSNIQGLPTWYEVRVAGDGWRGRRGGVDLMVAMNPQTWEKDVAEVDPGGYLFYDSTKPMPPSRFRDDITPLGIPLTAICNAEYTDARQRQLFKNIIYLGALSALLDIDPAAIDTLFGEQYKGKEVAARVESQGVPHGARLRAREFRVPAARSASRAATRSATRIFIDGNSAAALGSVYGGATVAAWYPITPSSSLAEAFQKYCRKFRTDPDIEEEALRDPAGGGRARVDRHGDRRGVERRARVHDDVGTRRVADAGVPRARVLRRDSGRAVRRAARQPVDRHADAHAAGGPHLLRVRVARRHQARDAAARGPDGGVRVRRAGVRSRRSPADADLRDARPRHRHAGLADRAFHVGRRARGWTAARS